jgi:RND family efflux transporter MFP subunit
MILASKAGAFENSDCLILPGQIVDLGGTIPGQLAMVSVDIGDRVTKDQIIASLRTEVQDAVMELATLRSTNLAAVEVARARLDFEQQELDRSESLKLRGVISDADMGVRQTAYQIRKEELKEAEMELSLSRLDLERAEAELEIRKIRAPIDGVISERSLDPGEYLRDDGNVVTIVQLDPLRVEVFLHQDYYDQVAVGDTVSVRPQLFGNVEYTAVITVIDPVIDAASATFQVRLSLPNPDGRITSGVRCVATF